MMRFAELMFLYLWILAAYLGAVALIAAAYRSVRGKVRRLLGGAPRRERADETAQRELVERTFLGYLASAVLLCMSLAVALFGSKQVQEDEGAFILVFVMLLPLLAASLYAFVCGTAALIQLMRARTAGPRGAKFWAAAVCGVVSALGYSALVVALWVSTPTD